MTSIYLFYLSNGRAKMMTLLIIVWSLLQAMLAYKGFYQDIEAFPPRFAYVLIPAMGLIIYGLLPKQQKWFIEHRNSHWSHFLHCVRLPVEIVLFQLYVYNSIPQMMTFEGWNFDIIMGITAPIVTYFICTQKINRKALIAWNGVGLMLILTILLIGILSSELPFQQFAFDQPNRAINYFPFILLPATIVPIVIWTHASELIKQIKEMN